MKQNARRSMALVIGVCAGIQPDFASGQEPPGAHTDSSSLAADNGLLLYESDDGSSRMWLDGRVVITAGRFFGSDNELDAGIELRRARFAVKTLFADDWAAELDVDLTDREVEVKDAWVGYVGWRNAMVTIGNQKVPNGLEQLETSRWITFIERSLPDQLISDRRLGVTARRWGRVWQASAGVFGEEPGGGAEDGDREGWGLAGRFSVSPRLGGNRILHLGVSGSTFTPDGGSERVRFRQRPETHFTERLLSTGHIEAVVRQRLLAMEVATHLGAITLQGEYINNRVARLDPEPDAGFSGWYASGSWMLNGGRRTYFHDSGEFGYPVHPDRRGILEVAFRYSKLVLNDRFVAVEGGLGENATIGLNWYPNRRVRFTTNLIWAFNDEFADGDGDLIGNDDFVVLAGLAQVVF